MMTENYNRSKVVEILAATLVTAGAATGSGTQWTTSIANVSGFNASQTFSSPIAIADALLPFVEKNLQSLLGQNYRAA